MWMLGLCMETLQRLGRTMNRIERYNKRRRSISHKSNRLALSLDKSMTLINVEI